MPNMILGIRSTKMSKILSLPAKVQPAVHLKKARTGRREANYGDTK